MQKLKLLILCLLSIFCLNSCLLTTAAAGTYLLGTMGTYYCAEYDCNLKKTKIEDPGGLEKIFTRKNSSQEVKNYFEAIKKRELEKYQLKTRMGENVIVNLPKSFILKKYFGETYYLYDEERKIGFYVIITDVRTKGHFQNLREIFEGTYYMKYKNLTNDKEVHTFISEDEKSIIKIKKITQNYYATIDETDLSKEIKDIYRYLLENL